MTTTPQQPARPSTPDAGQGSQEKHVAPIRWPKADRTTIAGLALWVVGLLVAVGPPALIVPPGQDDAPTGEVLLAFSITLLGSAIMLAAGWWLARRWHDMAVVTMGVVPAVALVATGVIMVATKLAPI